MYDDGRWFYWLTAALVIAALARAKYWLFDPGMIFGNGMFP